MAAIQCVVQRSNWYKVYFEYSYTQDKINATTALTHALKLEQITDSYDFDTVKEVTVSYTVAGKAFSKTGRININDKGNNGYTITLASGSSTITHDSASGVGSFTVSVDTSIESGGHGPGTIKLASKTVSLPTIYRASEPTVSSSSVKMGDKITINTNRKSSAFTHTITYSIGSATGVSIETGVEASFEWSVPDLTQYCPNAKSGTVTITCITYSGSSKIGEKTCNVTFNVPGSSAPTVSASSVTMGSKLTITTNRKSSAFTHTIKYSIGSASGVSIKTGAGASHEWTVPDLTQYCPNAKSGTLTITCITYNGTSKIGENTKTVTFNVPSASEPTADTSVVMGNRVNVTTNRKSSSFTHKVTWTFGSESGTASESAGSSTWFTAKLDLAKEIPSKTSGTGTITCVTYNGTAVVGTETCTFTATVPDNEDTKPTFTGSFSPVHDLPSGVAWPFIQGVSKVKATYNASSTYSTIASYKMTIDGETYSGNNAVSHIINRYGSVPVTLTVTDARGFSRTVNETVNITPYSAPTLLPYNVMKRIIVCDRCKPNGELADDGTSLRIECTPHTAAIWVQGEDKNDCVVSYAVRKGDGDFGAYTELVDTSVSDWVVYKTLSEVVNDTTSSYTVRLKITDTIGKSTTYDFHIPTSEITFHLKKGGDGAAFGKYAETSKALEVAEDWDIIMYGKRWKSLGLSSSVSASESAYGQVGGTDCCYRVENGNHVYVAFNCSYNYVGEPITVNKDKIPEDYRPTNLIYRLCATAGKYIARVYVSSYGNVVIEWLQDLLSTSETTEQARTWIDGYIDYWI